MSGSGISLAECKSAPRSGQITMPAPHYSVFYRPDALPVAQSTASKHWRQKVVQKNKPLNGRSSSSSHLWRYYTQQCYTLRYLLLLYCFGITDTWHKCTLSLLASSGRRSRDVCLHTPDRSRCRMSHWPTADCVCHSQNNSAHTHRHRHAGTAKWRKGLHRNRQFR